MKPLQCQIRLMFLQGVYESQRTVKFLTLSYEYPPKVYGHTTSIETNKFVEYNFSNIY